ANRPRCPPSRARGGRAQRSGGGPQAARAAPGRRGRGASARCWSNRSPRPARSRPRAARASSPPLGRQQRAAAVLVAAPAGILGLELRGVALVDDQAVVVVELFARL